MQDNFFNQSLASVELFKPVGGDILNTLHKTLLVEIWSNFLIKFLPVLYVLPGIKINPANR
jgi:hypothetical protein